MLSTLGIAIDYCIIAIMIDPSGKPIIMYTSPELYNTTDRIVPVFVPDVEVCIEECIFKDERPCSSPLVYQWCCDLMVENNLNLPHNVDEAINMYRSMRDAIYREL